MAYVIDTLDIESMPKGQLQKCWLIMGSDGLGLPMQIPILIAKGQNSGPVVGITAAIHGDELNGIRVVQTLFQDFDLESLQGTIVGIPLLNLPGALRRQRYYSDNKDLNRLMPGKSDGYESEFYAYQIVEKILKNLNYLFDLHTASFGRVNSHYVRANLNMPHVAEMAHFQNADIVLKEMNTTTGTLRGAAQVLGIPAITVELGNPNSFQASMISAGYAGISHWLRHMGILPPQKPLAGEIQPGEKTIYCKKSYWVYSNAGGILKVFPKLVDKISSGQEIAVMYDVFGDQTQSYFAPEAGIVIGKSVMPIGESGSRILHLGILDEKGV